MLPVTAIVYVSYHCPNDNIMVTMARIQYEDVILPIYIKLDHFLLL